MLSFSILHSLAPFILVKICFFMFSMYVLSSHKKLSYFNNPLLLIPLDFLIIEKVIGEWPVEMATTSNIRFPDSWKLLDVEKKFSLLWLYPEELCWQNECCLVFRFFILHVSYKSSFSLTCFTVCKDFFFRTSLTSKLKVTLSATILLVMSLIFYDILLGSVSVQSCSDSIPYFL